MHFLKNHGYETYECKTEEEARSRTGELISKGQWPCYFFESDTTGEKDFEEFFTANENLDMTQFESIGVIQNDAIFNDSQLENFIDGIEQLRKKGTWEKKNILDLYSILLPDFAHKETGKYLDQRM